MRDLLLTERLKVAEKLWWLSDDYLRQNPLAIQEMSLDVLTFLAGGMDKPQGR
jgi:hypothetical protein